jgi:hypothetical protein
VVEEDLEMLRLPEELVDKAVEDLETMLHKLILVEAVEGVTKEQDLLVKVVDQV